MTLTELRYVVAVARERHFGRAAEACFVSQPTLSVAIRKLEEELGVVLFERVRNAVRLTPVGEKVVEQAQQVLEQVESIRTTAKQNQDDLAYPLHLGAIYTIGPYLYPDLVPTLSTAAPKMPLFLVEDFTANLGTRLKKGELDAIVVSLPFDEAGLSTRVLYDEPFLVLLPSSHPLTAKDTISATDLNQENLLLLGAGHCFRDQVLSICPACNPANAPAHSLQRTLEGSSLETIRHMVASGMGITVLPCTAVGSARYSQRLLTVRRFTPPIPSRRIALAWRKGFPRTKAIETLIDAIKQASSTCAVVAEN